MLATTGAVLQQLRLDSMLWHDMDVNKIRQLPLGGFYLFDANPCDTRPVLVFFAWLDQEFASTPASKVAYARLAGLLKK